MGAKHSDSWRRANKPAGNQDDCDWLHVDPTPTDLEIEIEALEERGKIALSELSEMDQEEADRRQADELRQQVEQLEAEVAQRQQQKR